MGRRVKKKARRKKVRFEDEKQTKKKPTVKISEDVENLDLRRDAIPSQHILKKVSKHKKNRQGSKDQTEFKNIKIPRAVSIGRRLSLSGQQASPSLSTLLEQAFSDRTSPSTQTQFKSEILRKLTCPSKDAKSQSRDQATNMSKTKTNPIIVPKRYRLKPVIWQSASPRKSDLNDRSPDDSPFESSPTDPPYIFKRSFTDSPNLYNRGRIDSPNWYNKSPADSPKPVLLPSIAKAFPDSQSDSQKEKNQTVHTSKETPPSNSECTECKRSRSMSNWGNDFDSLSSGSTEGLFGLNDSESKLLNPDVMGVLERLKKMKSVRLEQDVQDELQAIHERVKIAMKRVDFLFEDEETHDKPKLPEILGDVTEKRGEAEHQMEVTEMVEGMIEGSQMIQGLLLDVDIWFDEMKSIGLDVKSDEEMDKFVASSHKMKDKVLKSLIKYENASKKMMGIGSKVIHEAGNIIKENEAQIQKMKKQGQDKIVIYDEHDLMVDPIKWDKAVKLIVNTFEDALKWTRNAAYKVTYTKTQKQFKNLASAMSKKIIDLSGKQREVDDLKKKLIDSKAGFEKKLQEYEELKKNIRRMSRNIEEQAKHIETQEKRNTALTKKLVYTEQQMKTLEKDHMAMETVMKRELAEKETELNAAKAKSETPAPPPNSPQPKKVILKVVDPEMVQKLKDTEEELEKAKGTISSLTEQVKDLELQIVRERVKIRNLKEEVVKAQKAAEEAAMTINVPDVPAELNEPTETGDKDSGYYKKLLRGMKKDFSQELEKIKSHLTKEKQRATASVKRGEITHKEHLNAIQKDVIRVLRSIMHFRDHICTVLEKEKLKDSVYSLQNLKNLVPDQLAPDPKELLSLLVANVVEYMHNMELIIANAFLIMRMKIKGSVPTYGESYATQRSLDKGTDVKVKDAETRIKTMDTARGDTTNIARRLQQAKDKLLMVEQMTDDQLKEKKYMALLDRYHMVWKMYSKLNKDMDILQGDFQTSIEEKIRDQEQLIITNIKLDLKQRRAFHEEELKLSVADQRQNLHILEKAYEENKISKDLYLMSTAMLQKAINIPGMRLKYIFEQYIAFRSVKDARARLSKILEDPDVAFDVRQDLESYMRRMEDKMHSNMGEWHERMRLLEDQRKNLDRGIWNLFNEVLAETGLLLVHPLFQKNKETGQVYSKMAQTLKRDQLKKILKKRVRVTDFLKLPPVLVGHNMSSKNLQPEGVFWKACGQGDLGNQPFVTTPHSLHYDINKSRIDAKRVVHDDNSSRQPYPLAKIQNYLMNPSMTILKV